MPSASLTAETTAGGAAEPDAAVAPISEALAEPDPVAEAAPAEPEAELVPAAPAVLRLPKMSPVAIRLSGAIGSNISQSGDGFAYEVARDVYVDDVVVIPAGTLGYGQVIHAKKAGGSGSAGELVLSPGELDLDGRKIRLRSLNMDAAGEDNMDVAMGVGAVAGFVGFLVKGKNYGYAPGFVGRAMTAQDLEFPAPAIAAQSASEILPTETVTEGNVQ
jgi:hypothetical protein